MSPLRNRAFIAFSISFRGLRPPAAQRCAHTAEAFPKPLTIAQFLSSALCRFCTLSLRWFDLTMSIINHKFSFKNRCPYEYSKKEEMSQICIL